MIKLVKHVRFTHGNRVVHSCDFERPIEIEPAEIRKGARYWYLGSRNQPCWERVEDLDRLNNGDWLLVCNEHHESWPEQSSLRGPNGPSNRWDSYVHELRESGWKELNNV